MKNLLKTVQGAITETTLAIHKHPILKKITLLIIAKTGHRLVEALVLTLGK